MRSGVAGNTRLGEGAFLVDLSSVAPGTSVPGGAEWAGSPARTRPVPTAPAYDPKKQCSGRRRAAYGAAQALGVLFLALTDGLPFVAASLLLVRAPSGAARVLEAPLYSAGVVAAVCAQILAVKWLVAGRIRPGEYPSQGLVALRRWFSDKLIELQKGVIMAVYDTLYTRPWCVALGMKCGPRAEIALPARMPYELVELGSDGFIASDTSIGTPLRRNGTLVLEKTVAGDRVFVGNNSVLPQGARVPDDTLLGALTLGPRLGDMGAEPGQSWLGSPAFPLPRREKVEAFDVRLTYRPTTALYAERLIHETGRILLPGVASLGAAALLADGFLAVWRTASLAAALLCAPFLYTGVAALSVAAVYAFKKLMIGTYRPTAQPLWSRYVWKAETVSAFFHDFGGELFLGPLLGTPLMATFLRLMGAKVGRRAFVDTGDLTEFDLIRVGEDAAVNHGAALQAHLFEDRVMKVGTLKIGDRCSVGTYAVVLFDTELQIDSHVGQMSLVMKGEVIPSATVWEGAPAQAKRGNTAGATLYAEARR